MILHIDMDAFYASVEQRDRPELADRPVVVGGTPEGRGVVAAANYAARRFGIHSAMPAVTARRLCPRAVFLRPRMDYYAEVSDKIRAIFEHYTPLVEPLSLDEAFLDVTASQSLFGNAVNIGRMIKQRVQEQLSLVASVGVAPNKFLAKIASDLKKPNGFVIVSAEQIHAFLDPLPVGRLWGVGRVTNKLFDQLGIHTVGQLRRLPVELLEQHFGNQGRHLWELAHGIDDRPVIPEQLAKSISHEKTFPHDLDDREAIRAWLLELSEQVACRVRRHKLKGRTIHLKLRFDDFRTITRSHTLADPTNGTQQIWEAAMQMLTQRVSSGPLRVRLLGIGISGFDRRTRRQLNLFSDPCQEREEHLDATTDRIREKFGGASIQRATGMRYGIQPKTKPDGMNRDQYGE